MKLERFFLFFIGLMTIFALSCSSDDDESVIDGGTDEEETVEEGTENNVDENFVTNSQDTTFVNAVTIAFSGTTATVDNPYAEDGVSIVTDGADVVVTSTNTVTEINYVLSGSTTNGSVKIYSDYKFGLGFNGVDIISGDGPALNIQSGKKVTITLVGGTSNRLIDGTTYTATSNEDMKAAFFSEGQLIFGGAGSLQVQGRYKHGICSDDYIRINGGVVKVAGAVKDAIHANDYIRIDGGTVNLVSTGDGMECEEGYIEINGGDIKISTVEGDAIKTSYSGTDTSITPYITVNGGTFDITTVGKGSKGLKSKGDITIAKGTLIFVSKGAAYYDTDDADISSASAIKADGNFLMQDGTVTITSSGSGGKGISIDGTITIDNGTINVTTTGDQFVYGSDDTAAKAIKSDGDLTVNNGTITIKTTKTEAEGLESKATLTINGGTIEIETYDDCINASNHIAINGGSIYCYSETNDGIDSNGTLTITGGTIVSSGTTSPEEGIDCDNNTFKITGGTVIGFGGATSTPTSSVTTQRCVIYGGTGTANQLIHIASSDGTGVLTVKVPRSYNSQMVMLVSSPDLKASTSYTIYTGGSVSGGTDFHGLYSGETYTKGTSANTFTTSSMVTTVGNVSSGGGMGGGGR
ncbi:carbohydrate-binding domain-containing protein [Dysgonomonas macrotermitis]|uniref:Carbohydrate-binding domain-containing protein n=1 Tax=Dysgonomonas macrotermitis TaxID=1346286 RepID=A0A1M4U671_9BACT|nr:carbohydrate-binding domain-containing protein [Dysgonomonas macrotermitis]SHE52331.1 protein of unknown function [Dysgonomonas macrotermitis]